MSDNEGGQDELDAVRGAEPASETPHFDAIFCRYASDTESFGTEHLGSLLLDMGFNAAPRVLDQALDDMDPDATGEISKLTFLEWFEENADDLETPAVGQHTQQQVGPPSSALSPRSADKADDAAICELQSAMLDAKKQRKRVEVDVQLLANRLTHLRTEDVRAQKRIEEANRRAKEIEAVKKRNEERQRVKQRAIEQMQRDIRAQCEYNSMLQVSARDRKQQNATEITAIRSQIVQETRAERAANLEAIQRARAMDRSVYAERTKEIRVQEKSALQRRDQLKKNQQKELVKNARANLAIEHQKKLVSEKLIQKMEKEEAALIEKLRVTQDLQRAAYEHLEFVMQDE